MAKNETLRTEAYELAGKLKLDIGDIAEHTNAQLTELVKDLRAKVSDAETNTAADGAASTEGGDNQADKGDDQGGDDQADKAETETKAPAKPTKKVAKGPHVCEGKSVTTLRGILGEGESISASDLSGGDDAYKLLRKKGYIEG